MLSQIRTGKSSLRRRHGALLETGFTLIELMIVVTIVLILIGMAVANYAKVVQYAKEAVLKYDLRAMREMIDHYTVDKETAPQSLEGIPLPIPRNGRQSMTACPCFQIKPAPELLM